MRMLTLLLVVIGVTVSQARPQSGQDVLDNQEFVTTDNPQAVNIGDDDLELAGEDKDSFLLVDEDPDEEDVTIPYETTPDSIDYEEDATETIIVEDVADNLVDRTQAIIVEEEKEITLRITDYSDSSVVFRKTSPILGMSCDASSEVDNDIKYMWTKNGRFIDTSSSHVTFETKNNGNLIIYNPEEDDEGVYQCVVSNSEGVVFSRVTKVKMLRPRARSLVTDSVRLVDSDEVTVYLPVSNNGKFNEDEEAENVFLVMPASDSEQ